MIIRLALALEVTTDELLGMKLSQKDGNKPGMKIVRRLKKIETLPTSQQTIILKTIDAFFKASEK